MRALNLDRAADYMEAWAQGRLERGPLLDISAHLGLSQFLHSKVLGRGYWFSEMSS